MKTFKDFTSLAQSFKAKPTVDNTATKKDGPRAGLLPYYIKDNEIYIAFMVPSNPKFGGDKPQIAKGHIEPGYTAIETAIKEGHEELGYIHQHHYDVRLLWNDARTNIAWYFVKVDDTTLDKHCWETKQVVWIEINKAEKTIREWQRIVIKVLKRRLGLSR